MNRRFEPLSDGEIANVAPSAFAVEPWAGVSDRYSFIPTSRVISAMREAGFLPSSAQQSVVRISSKQNFTKHLIRFRQDMNFTTVGEIAPELILINGHDRSTSYRLMFGLIRFACLNGMIVSDGTVESISVRHTGNIVNEVLDASMKLIDRAELVNNTINRWKALPMSTSEINLFGSQALQLKYGEDAPKGLLPENVTSSRRYDDTPDNLWTVFNRTQENLIRGRHNAFLPQHEDGTYVRNSHCQRVRHSIRGVTGIDQNTKLNQLLWTLATAFADLKS